MSGWRSSRRRRWHGAHHDLHRPQTASSLRNLLSRVWAHAGSAVVAGLRKRVRRMSSSGEGATHSSLDRGHHLSPVSLLARRQASEQPKGDSDPDSADITLGPGGEISGEMLRPVLVRPRRPFPTAQKSNLCDVTGDRCAQLEERDEMERELEMLKKQIESSLPPSPARKG